MPGLAEWKTKVRNRYGAGRTPASMTPRLSSAGKALNPSPSGLERSRRSGPMAICRLRVPLPESAWIAQFSHEYPEVQVDVLSRLDVDRSRSLTEIQVNASTPDGWADTIRGLPGVSSVEELARAIGRIHLRVVHTTSPFIPIFRELRLMRRFPFTIKKGDALWVIIAPKSKHRTLLARLRAQ